MKKKFWSLVLGTLLLAMFTVSASAASRLCPTCKITMKETNQYTTWITQEFVRCAHGKANSKDAVQTRIEVKTFICPNCQFGSIEEATEERYQCFGRKVVTKCTNCESGEVILIDHYASPWISVAKTEDGLYTQEQTDVVWYRCFNCGHDTTNEETLSRTVKLH